MKNVKITPKEQVAIDELVHLAKRWPRTLLLGGDGGGERFFFIWKKSEPGVHVVVAQLPCIKNLDAW